MRRRAAWGALCSVLVVGCGAGRGGSDEAPAPVLTLLHTSDLHSRLWPFRARISSFEAERGLGELGALVEVGGVARLATLLEAERRRGDALWIDSGDALEGAPIFQREGGRVELELLGGLGLSAMALGNHELSLKAEPLAELLRSAARFPVLAANLPPLAGSELSGLLRPSVVLESQGLEVGVIGVANPNSPPGVEHQPRNAWGLSPAPKVAAAVQLAIDELAPRADLIVVLSHLGLDADRALVRGTSGVAIVLGGHQHLLTARPEWEEDRSSRRVPIVHSGAYGQWLNRLELQLTRDRSGRSVLTGVTSRALPLAASVPEDPEVVARLAPYRAPPEPPLAFAADTLERGSPLGGDSALGDLTADAVRLKSVTDVALFNSSGLRDDLEAGVILRSDLELAFPFAEPWVVARLPGRDLRRALVSAARRSAARGCESSLQVAGLRLRVRCAECTADPEGCVDVRRDTPLGRASLLDDEQLLVALPEYLTLPGADFELAAGAGELVELSVPDALSELLSRLPTASDARPCLTALAAWSPARCFEAFGELGCPVDSARGEAICAALPRLEEARDGRIEMQP